jgi:hypothetical protein
MRGNAMSTLMNHALIAALLGAVIVTLLVVFRGRLQLAWGGNVIPVIHTLTVTSAVVVANALLRTYVY